MPSCQLNLEALVFFIANFKISLSQEVISKRTDYHYKDVEHNEIRSPLLALSVKCNFGPIEES